MRRSGQRRDQARSRPAVAATALAALGLATATVHGEPLPAGRVSAVAGVKNGTGALASSLGTGYAFGFEAAYAPLRAPQTIGVGLTWSLLFSDFGSGSARLTGALKTVEFDAGLRLRLMIGPRRRTVAYLGGGGVITRSNEPLFDGSDRSYIGPFGAVGVETATAKVWIVPALAVGLGLRFATVDSGRGTLGLMLSVGGR